MIFLSTGDRIFIGVVNSLSVDTNVPSTPATNPITSNKTVRYISVETEVTAGIDLYFPDQADIPSVIFDGEVKVYKKTNTEIESFDGFIVSALHSNRKIGDHIVYDIEVQLFEKGINVEVLIQ